MEIEIRQRAIKEAHDAARKEQVKEMNRLLAKREKVQEQDKLGERIMRATANEANGKNAYYSLLDIAHLQCGRYKEVVLGTGA